MGPLGEEGHVEDELVEEVLICMLFLHHICMLFMYCLEYSPGRFPAGPHSPCLPSRGAGAHELRWGVEGAGGRGGGWAPAPPQAAGVRTLCPEPEQKVGPPPHPLVGKPGAWWERMCGEREEPRSWEGGGWRNAGYAGMESFILDQGPEGRKPDEGPAPESL